MPSHSYQLVDEALVRAEKHLKGLLSNRQNEISRSSDIRSTMSGAKQCLSSDMERAFIDYTEAANKSITSRILNLPRELRDAIYNYLWEPDSRCDPNRDLLYWWEHFDEPWIAQDSMSRHSSLPVIITSLRPPHFVDHAFVGKPFAIEVLKWFKDSIGKDLRPQGTQNPVAECLLLDASMEAFVNKDIFGVGMTVDELTRNLDLNIDFQCDALESALDEGVSALLNMPFTQRMVIYDQTRKNVTVRPRIITFAIRQECVTSIHATLVPILRLVLRAYKGLKTKGFTVKVRYHSEELGLKVTFDNATFSWTEDDWRKNLQEKNVSRVERAEVDVEKQALAWMTIKEELFTIKDDHQR
ncbi:hypothetical protein IQ07DRAFT_426674 [Pyrenochaeta sp. DS3sAY3a]|nr:hypothetical protein IQ07DRAFT_426674 [Pyrenochaeta sp. DS3sAY3a]